MPIVLAFVACLASAPNECRVVELQVESSPHWCAVGIASQAEIARWLAHQPERWVKRGRHECRAGERA